MSVSNNKMHSFESCFLGKEQVLGTDSHGYQQRNQYILNGNCIVPLTTPSVRMKQKAVQHHTALHQDLKQGDLFVSDILLCLQFAGRGRGFGSGGAG